MCSRLIVCPSLLSVCTRIHTRIGWGISSEHLHVNDKRIIFIAVGPHSLHTTHANSLAQLTHSLTHSTHVLHSLVRHVLCVARVHPHLEARLYALLPLSSSSLHPHLNSLSLVCILFSSFENSVGSWCHSFAHLHCCAALSSHWHLVSQCCSLVIITAHNRS